MNESLIIASPSHVPTEIDFKNLNSLQLVHNYLSKFEEFNPNKSNILTAQYFDYNYDGICIKRGGNNNNNYGGYLPIFTLNLLYRPIRIDYNFYLKSISATASNYSTTFSAEFMLNYGTKYGSVVLCALRNGTLAWNNRSGFYPHIYHNYYGNSIFWTNVSRTGNVCQPFATSSAHEYNITVREKDCYMASKELVPNQIFQFYDGYYNNGTSSNNITGKLFYLKKIKIYY